MNRTSFFAIATARRLASGDFRCTSFIMSIAKITSALLATAATCRLASGGVSSAMLMSLSSSVVTATWLAVACVRMTHNAVFS